MTCHDNTWNWGSLRALETQALEMKPEEAVKHLREVTGWSETTCRLWYGEIVEEEIEHHLKRIGNQQTEPKPTEGP